MMAALTIDRSAGTAVAAATELNAIFEKIVPRLRNPQLAGPVRRLRSNFVNGVKEMPIRVEPGERAR